MRPTILHAFVVAILSTCVSAQSLLKPKDVNYKDLYILDERYNINRNCSTVEREEVRDNQVKYLWFNDHSITEYSSLLEEILETYSEEKFDQINLSWRPADKVHPFRRLESSGSDSQWIQIDNDD